MSGIAYPGGVSSDWTYVDNDELDDDDTPIAQMSDVEGITWNYGYNDDDEIEKVTDPDSGETSYLHDHDCPAEVVDALGRHWHSDSGPDGPIQSTTPEGRTELFSYDDDGEL